MGRRVALLAGLLAAAVARPQAGPAAPADPVVPPMPAVRVGEFQVAVERVDESENTAFEFDDSPSAVLSGRKAVTLGLTIRARKPESLLRLDRLESRFLAFDAQNRPLNFLVESTEELTQLRLQTWRARMQAPDVGLDVDRFYRTQGELLVYPKARVLTVDFPLPAPTTPVVRTPGEMKLTLTSAALRPAALEASVEMEWTGALAMQRVNQDNLIGLSAVLPGDIEVLPNGRMSSSTVVRDGVTRRTCVVSFFGLAQQPVRLRFKSIVRSGTPERLAFTLPTIPLPSSQRLTPEPGEPVGVDAQSPLVRGHPFYRLEGGALRVLTHRPAGSSDAASPETVGLSLREPGGWSAWRWMEVLPESDGSFLVRRIIPGRYRLAWSRGGMGEVEILPGREVRWTAPSGSEP